MKLASAASRAVTFKLMRDRLSERVALRAAPRYRKIDSEEFSEHPTRKAVRVSASGFPSHDKWFQMSDLIAPARLLVN